MTEVKGTRIRSTSFEAPDLGPTNRLIRPSKFTLIVIAIGLVLSFIGWFLFTASSVYLDLEPFNAKFEIQGRLHYQLGDRQLIIPGEIRISAFADGYFDLEQTVQIADRPNQIVKLSLEPLPGKINIVSNAPGAKVFLGDSLLGVTPIDSAAIPAGSHQIQVVHPRFVDDNFEIKVTGRGLAQTFDLNLEPAWADVEITTNPTNAEILVDGQTIARTPAIVQIIEGQRNLELKLTGHKSIVRKLRVTRGEPLSLTNISLAIADAMLTVETSPSGGSIQINGNYRGQSPIKVAVDANVELKVVATKAGYIPVERDIKLSPNTRQDIVLNLAPSMGSLKIVVQPEDATIRLDGKLAADLKGGAQLLSKPYLLTVSKPGYAEIKQTVTPIAGQSQVLSFELQTIAAAEFASLPNLVRTAQGSPLKLIPSGEVSLGAPRRARGRRSNEIERRVTISKPFYLGQFEVTNREFLQFDPSHNPGLMGRILLNESDRPAVNINWDRAVAFCNWLSLEEGLNPAYSQVGGEWQLMQPLTNGYRLPSEAEWVLALTASDKRGLKPTFPWGEVLPPTEILGNLADETAKDTVPYIVEGYDDGYRGPSPVGRFIPNRFGLYDLVGNAAEWVNDRYSVSGSEGPERDRFGPQTGNLFVIRGSSYLMGRFGELRTAYRDFGKEGRQDVGFRIARSLPQSSEP